MRPDGSSSPVPPCLPIELPAHRETVDWKAGVPVSEMLETFSDFDPRLLKVMRFAASSLMSWTKI